MKYLLGKELANEVFPRQDYIYDVFKLYTSLNYDCGDFIEFSSVPTNELDTLIIIGHDNIVETYLRDNKNKIQEKTVIIISCNAIELKKHIENKEVYISLNDKGITSKRDGKDYGFDFNVTESEINLYNAKGTIEERIRMSFEKLE